MGTALHAFLEHADFAALAAAKQAGTLEMAIPAERDRRWKQSSPHPKLRRSWSRAHPPLCGERSLCAHLCLRMRCCGSWTLSRPCLPAEVLAAQGTAPADSAAVAQAKVLVQGIADLVLVFPDHLELLDYKTDRRKSEADFLAAYRAQLDLYALAISKRFAPKPVTYKGIYSLELGKLIEVE